MKSHKAIKLSVVGFLAVTFIWAYLTLMLARPEWHSQLVRISRPIRTTNETGAASLKVTITNLSERTIHLDAWMGEVRSGNHCPPMNTNTLVHVGLVRPRSVAVVQVPEFISAASVRTFICAAATPVASWQRRLMDRTARLIGRIPGLQLSGWRTYTMYRAPSGLIMLDETEARMAFSDEVERNLPLNLELKSESAAQVAIRFGSNSMKE